MSKEFCIGFDEQTQPITATWPNIPGMSDPMGLTYKDVTLLSQKTQITSREEPKYEGDPERVDILAEFPGLPGRHLPIILAPMDTIVGYEMARAAAEEKVIPTLPRVNDKEKGLALCNKAATEGIPFIQAIGLEHAVEDAMAYEQHGAKVLLLDIANGYRDDYAGACRAIKERLPHIEVVGGNVGFGNGVRHLMEQGMVSSTRVGFSMGGACETWVVSRHGSPMLSAVLSCHDIQDANIIADGSIQDPGDLVVALAGGAVAGMVGSIVAGTDEAPGEIVYLHGDPYKRFRGQASASYTADHSKKVQNHRRTAEGVDVLVPYAGSVRPILQRLAAGIVSGCSYSGVNSIKQLQQQAIFFRNSETAIGRGGAHIGGKNGTLTFDKYRRQRSVFDMGRNLLQRMRDQAT